jgi:hypothetical protein
MNRYLHGATVLGNISQAWQAPGSSADSGAAMVDPTGITYGIRQMLNPGQGAGRYSLSTTPNAYWAQQRAQQSPFAASTAANHQSGLQLQQLLRQQQAANLAALKAQLASMPVAQPNVPGTPMAPNPYGGMAPTFAPQSYAPPSSVYAQSPVSSAPGDASSDGGAPFNGAYTDDASVVGAATGQPAIVVRVRDVGAVLKQKSAAGSLLYDFAPATLSNYTLTEMAKKIGEGLKAEGVDADVQVATSPPSGPPPKSDFMTGAAVGVASVGVGWGLWRLIGLLF